MFKNTQELSNLYFYRKCWLECMIVALRLWKQTDDDSFLEWAKTYGEYSKRDKLKIDRLSTIR